MVFEDSTAGVVAAKAAGMAVITIAATHAGAVATSDPLITDYRSLRWEATDDGIVLSIATDNDHG